VIPPVGGKGLSLRKIRMGGPSLKKGKNHSGVIERETRKLPLTVLTTSKSEVRESARGAEEFIRKGFARVVVEVIETAREKGAGGGNVKETDYLQPALKRRRQPTRPSEVRRSRKRGPVPNEKQEEEKGRKGRRDISPTRRRQSRRARIEKKWGNAGPP